MTDALFFAHLSGLFAADITLTIYILFHNGQKVNRFFATFIEWWGPEGVVVVKTAVYLFVLVFTSHLELQMQVGLLAIWALFLVWDLYQIYRLITQKDKDDSAD